MPLNNALSYVARNFESYQKRVRDLKTIAPKPTFDPSRMPPGFIAPDDKIIYYLHLLADSRMLTTEELAEVIDFVQKRIHALANAEETMEKTRTFYILFLNIHIGGMALCACHFGDGGRFSLVARAIVIIVVNTRVCVCA